MPDQFVLEGYFRSSASYRVRIALNLKRVTYQNVFRHLRKGEQRSPDYLALNPQGLLPTLLVNGQPLTQSLAICEYLDEILPEPRLLPSDAWERARTRALAQVIACDVHPIQNLKILKRLREMGQGEDAVSAWAAQVIGEGLSAFDTLLEADGPYCMGEHVSLADLCLIPQLSNARRFGVEMAWPRIVEIEKNCLALDAFARAQPESQPDAD